MNKIAEKLINFGMDFQYENWGSEGEKIASFETNIEVTRQNGKVYFYWLGEQTVLHDCESAINVIARLVEEACIRQTN